MDAQNTSVAEKHNTNKHLSLYFSINPRTIILAHKLLKQGLGERERRVGGGHVGPVCKGKRHTQKVTRGFCAKRADTQKNFTCGL